MSSRGGSRRCEAVRADGKRCKAWAVRGSEPARCSSHSGLTGAPKDNRNAYKHGGYARPVDEIGGIEDAVADLEYRLTNLTHFVDEAEDKADMMAALALYGQMISRYGRLLRDKRALSGESADNILELLGQAAEEVATELGWTAFEG